MARSNLSFAPSFSSVYAFRFIMKSIQSVYDEVQKLVRQFAQLNSRLFTDLPRESPQAPQQYSIKAVQEHDDADNEPRDSETMTIRLNLPKTITTKDNAANHQKPWLKDRKFILELSAVIVALIVATIYYLQLQAMQNALRVDQRPWIKMIVTTGNVTVNAPVQSVIQFTNNGKTPAIEIFGEVVIEKIVNGQQPRLDSSAPHGNFTTGLLFPNETSQNGFQPYAISGNRDGS